MRFKKLTSDEELEQYRNAFLTNYQQRAEKVGRDLPLSYLRTCTVICALDRHHRMLAGYVLGTTSPFRLLDFVPESARDSLVVPYHGRWSDCCEVTCAWKLPEVSLLFMSACFWPNALFGVLRTRKRILLGGNQNVQLDKFYTTLWPATIYSGVSSFGLPSRLFAYNRRRIILSIICLWAYETPRRLLKKIFNG